MNSSVSTDELIAKGISVAIGHSAENIEGADCVIRTAAANNDNPEIAAARSAGVPVFERAQAWGVIMRAYKNAVCVAGTHGKTTTSTLLAHLLNQREQKVNAFLGGIAKNYDTNLLTSKQSNDVVVEADEYDRSFLRLTPKMAIITATDADHLDIYGSHQELLKGFADFTALIQPGGTLVMKKGLELIPTTHTDVQVATYSASEPADYYAENITTQNGRLFFDFVSPKGRIEQVELGVPVLINVENAVAAMAIAQLNGATDQQLRQGVASFKGNKRRFDMQVKHDKKVYIDDYAHHPAEIQACVASIRHLYPDKKICGVFQPHLYTRTRDFAAEFAQSLSLLDDVILLDIYPARELPIKGVTSQLIAKSITHKNKTICSPKEALVEELKNHTFDVLITIGAGNIDQEVPKVAQYIESLSNE
jgi:UDP-N-acetylmuramate--alanine ligase